MLRDRTPRTVILALKWCKSLEAWLDHVYKTRIWLYPSNKKRLEETKYVLNRKGETTAEWFEGTLDWANLSAEEKERWTRVIGWVSWFSQKHYYVQNTYDVSKKVGKSIEEIKLEIIKTHLMSMCPTTQDDAKERKRKNDCVNSFADFLINSFENRI